MTEPVNMKQKQAIDLITSAFASLIRRSGGSLEFTESELRFTGDIITTTNAGSKTVIFTVVDKEWKN